MVSAGLEGTWCRVEDARGAEADPVVTPCEHQAYYRYYKAKAERLAAAPPKPFLIMTPAEEFVVRVSYFLSGHWSDAFSR